MIATKPHTIAVMSRTASSDAVPDALGHFGPYGGTFVPETLVAALEQLRAEYDKAKNDPAFDEEFQYYLREYVGRPSRLYFAKRLTERTFFSTLKTRN